MPWLLAQETAETAGTAGAASHPTLAVAILLGLAVLMLFTAVAALVRERTWGDKLLWAAVILGTCSVGAVLYLTFWWVAWKQRRGHPEGPPAGGGPGP